MEVMISLGSLIPGRNNCSPIGLEIGASTVKMAQLHQISGKWAVRGMVSREVPHIDSENGTSRTDAIISIIRDCLKTSSLSGRSVVSVVPDYQLDIFPVKISISEGESLEEAILAEARSRLSYSVEEAVIDYLPCEDNGTVHEPGTTARYLLISARREDVDELLAVLKGARLKPSALDMSACALARLLEMSGVSRSGNELIINAGELHSTLTVLWQGNILFDRNVLWGTEPVIEILMNRLKLEREKAGRLLRKVGLHAVYSGASAAGSATDEQSSQLADTVYEIVSSELEKITREIDKVSQFFSSEMRGAVIDAIHLMGAAGTIRDLDIYLEKRTGIKTAGFDPLQSMEKGNKGGSSLIDCDSSGFGVPLGLAMRGLTSGNGGSE